MSLSFDPHKLVEDHLTDHKSSTLSTTSDVVSTTLNDDPILDQMDTDMATMMANDCTSNIRHAMSSLLSASAPPANVVPPRPAPVAISRLERLDHNLASQPARPLGSRNGRKPRVSNNPFDTLVPKEISPAALPMSIIPSATHTSIAILPAKSFGESALRNSARFPSGPSNSRYAASGSHSAVSPTRTAALNASSALHSDGKPAIFRKKSDRVSFAGAPDAIISSFSSSSSSSSASSFAFPATSAAQLSPSLTSTLMDTNTGTSTTATAISSVLSTDVMSQNSMGISGTGISTVTRTASAHGWMRGNEEKKQPGFKHAKAHIPSFPLSSSASINPTNSSSNANTTAITTREPLQNNENTKPDTKSPTSIKKMENSPVLSGKVDPITAVLSRGGNLQRWLGACDTEYMKDSIFVLSKNSEGTSEEENPENSKKPDFLKAFSLTSSRDILAGASSPTSSSSSSGTVSSLTSNTTNTTVTTDKKTAIGSNDVGVDKTGSLKSDINSKINDFTCRHDDSKAIAPSSPLPNSTSSATSTSSTSTSPTASLVDIHAAERDKRVQYLLDQCAASRAFREMVKTQQQQRHEALKALGVGSEGLLDELFPEMENPNSGKKNRKNKSANSRYPSRSPSRGKETSVPLEGNTSDGIVESNPELPNYESSSKIPDAHDDVHEDHEDHMKELLNRLFELGMSGILDEEALLIPNSRKDNVLPLLNRENLTSKNAPVQNFPTDPTSSSLSSSSTSTPSTPSSSNSTATSTSASGPAPSLHDTLWRLCADRLEAATAAGYGDAPSYRHLLDPSLSTSTSIASASSSLASPSSLSSPATRSPGNMSLGKSPNDREGDGRSPLGRSRRVGKDESGKNENSRNVSKFPGSPSQSPRKLRHRSPSNTSPSRLSINNPNTSPGTTDNSGTGVVQHVSRALSRRARRLAAHAVVSVSSIPGGAYHQCFGREEPLFAVHTVPPAVPNEDGAVKAQGAAVVGGNVTSRQENRENGRVSGISEIPDDGLRDSENDIPQPSLSTISMQMLPTSESMGTYASSSSKNGDNDSEMLVSASPRTPFTPSTSTPTSIPALSTLPAHSTLSRLSSSASVSYTRPSFASALAASLPPSSEPPSTLQIAEMLQVPQTVLMSSRHYPPRPLQVASADAQQQREKALQELRKVSNIPNSGDNSGNGKKVIPGLPPSLTVDAPLPHNPSLPVLNLSYFSPPPPPDLAHASETAVSIPQLLSLFALPIAQRPPQALRPLAELLRPLPFFSSLPPALTALVLAHGVCTSVPAGQIACPVRPPHGDLYVVLSGALSTTVASTYRSSIGPGTCVGSLMYDPPAATDLVPNTSTSATSASASAGPAADQIASEPGVAEDVSSSVTTTTTTTDAAVDAGASAMVSPETQPPGNVDDGNHSDNGNSNDSNCSGGSGANGGVDGVDVDTTASPSSLLTSGDNINSNSNTTDTNTTARSLTSSPASTSSSASSTSSSSLSTEMYVASTDSTVLYLSPASYRALLRNGLAVHLAKSLNALSRIPCLSSLPPLHLLELAKVAAPLALPPSSLILAQGTQQLAAGVYVLVEGSAVVARRTVKYVCDCRAGRAWRRLLLRKVMSGAWRGDAGMVHRVLNGDVDGISELGQQLEVDMGLGTGKGRGKGSASHRSHGYGHGPDLAVQQCKDPHDCPSPAKKTIVVDVGRLHAPCLIGEVSVGTNTPREAHVYTETNALVLRIARPDYAKLVPMRVRQELVSIALKKNKYSSDTIVRNTLRQQWEWGKLKQKLTEALLESQRLGLHR